MIGRILMGKYTVTNQMLVKRGVKLLRAQYGIPPRFGLEINLEQAYRIAIKYLGEQMRGRIKLASLVPMMNIYDRDRLKSSWVVRVPSPLGQSMTGPGRIICISRKTGKILYDGSDGGE
jgi:hypothetical protein